MQMKIFSELISLPLFSGTEHLVAGDCFFLPLYKEVAFDPQPEFEACC